MASSVVLPTFITHKTGPLAAALHYAMAGVRVHPVVLPEGAKAGPYGEKLDLIPLERWQEQASADPEQVAAWWADTPDAAVGIVPGPRMVVFDLDREGGWDHLVDLFRQHDADDSVRTTTVLSRGAGSPNNMHLYYVLPEMLWDTPIGNAAAILGGHGEVRSSAGFVLAPPTVHHLTEGGEPVHYEFAPGTPSNPSTLPLAIAQLLNEASQGKRKYKEAVAVEGNGMPMERASLDRYREETESRNGAAYLLAVRELAPRVLTGEWSILACEVAVFEAMSDAGCLEGPGGRSRRRLQDEAHRIVKSALEHADEPRPQVPAFEPTGGLWDKPEPPATPPPTSTPGLDPLNRSYPATETGMAERFIAVAGDHYLATVGGKRDNTYIWTGHLWAYDEGRRLRVEVSRFAAKLAKQAFVTLAGLTEDHPDAASLKATGKLAEKVAGSDVFGSRVSRSVGDRLKVVTAELFDDGELVDAGTGEVLNANEVINTPSGIRSVLTGEVVEVAVWRSGDLVSRFPLVTMTTPADPAPSKGSMWVDYLEWKIPEEGSRDALQRLMGGALIGGRMQRATYLVGQGGSGKSTLSDAIVSAMGDYAGPLSDKLLTASGGVSGADYAWASVRGKRLITTNETERSDALQASVLKALTGGQQRQVREIRQEPVTIRPVCSVLTTSNHLPVTPGGDSGLARRLGVIEMDVTAFMPGTDSLADDLALKFKHSEAGEVLGWLLEGAQRYLEHGLSDVADVFSPDEWLAEDDDVATFLDTICTRGDRELSFAADLYAAYQVWCSENSQQCATKRAFGSRVNDYLGVRADLVYVKDLNRQFRVRWGVSVPPAFLRTAQEWHRRNPRSDEEIIGALIVDEDEAVRLEKLRPVATNFDADELPKRVWS